MGWKVPSSKFRVLTYLPFLKKDGWDYRIVAGGTGLMKKREILRAAPDFDLVFIQKKLFDPLFLNLLARRNPNIIFDFDDALFAYEPTGKPLRLKKPGTPYTKQRLNNVLAQAVHVIAGNANLAEYAESYSRKLTIIQTPVNLSDYIEKTGKDEPIVIGWLGTGRNLVYLREIEGVVQNVSRRFPEVEWRILSDRPYSLDGVPVRNILWDDDTAFLQEWINEAKYRVRLFLDHSHAEGAFYEGPSYGSATLGRIGVLAWALRVCGDEEMLQHDAWQQFADGYLYEIMPGTR